MQECVDVLINCVVQNIGFSQGKPVAALTIYKCLLYWKSFEAEKTSVFDRLIQVIGSAIEVCAAYQLSIFFSGNIIILTPEYLWHLDLCLSKNKTLVFFI